MRNTQQRIAKVCLSLIVVVGLSNWRPLVGADNAERPRRKLVSENSEYISIDNGAEADYFEGYSRISYHTDTGFISTGVNNETSEDDETIKDAYFGRQLKTMRSFPEGRRNCYSLKPKGGKSCKYHITALFQYTSAAYGSFDLYIGVNYWDTIHLTVFMTYGGETEIRVADAIFFATADNIDVCLVNTDGGIPVISLLELRLLRDSIHGTASYPTPMALKIRKNLGMLEHEGDYVRYIDDIYSRVWVVVPIISSESSGPNSPDGKSSISNYQGNVLSSAANSVIPDSNNNANVPLNTSVVFNIGDMKDDFKLPRQVLSTAVCALTKNSSLNISESIDDSNEGDQFLLYLHFFEFEEKAQYQNGRIMNISFNGESILQDPLTLQYWQPITIAHTFTANASVGIRIIITSTPDSHFPAMLNAYEIYRLLPQSNLTTAQEDVEAMWKIKHTYNISKSSWQGDPCAPRDLTWEGLTCSFDDDIPRVTEINLNSSNLTGEIAASFAHLTELQKLDLSNNQLTGNVPEFLANLSSLNLARNHLTGTLPKCLRDKINDNDFIFRFEGNPDLCQKHSCKNKILIPGIIAGIIASLVIMIILITIMWWRARKKQAARKNEQLLSKNRVFSYAEILSITDNFKTIIGNVYLGALKDFTQVAIKLLSKSSMQGYKEFQSEAQLLMIVHHKNLVPLIGYCNEGDIKALVYEYMIMGNLQQQLSDKNPNVLDWRKRIQIALDAAHGLDYLHNGCKPPIIHRDLKPSNILLNEDMQAKIADFGLSKAFTNDIDTHISTRPAGTMGYLDPEFHKTGNLTKRSDVYSFGIILLELLTGQQAVIETPSGNADHILRWIIPRVESKDIQSIVDLRLQGMFNHASAWKFLDIAMSCSPSNAIERPDIAQILSELRDCLALEIATESAPSSSKSSIKSLGALLPKSEIGSHGK